MRMSLKTKLLGSFAIVLILMIGVAYWGIKTAGDLNVDVVDLGDVQLKKAVLSGDLATGLATMRRYELQSAVRGMLNDRKVMAEYLKKVEEFSSKNEEDITEISKMTQSAEGKKICMELETLWKEYLDSNTRFVQLVNENKFNEAIAFYNVDSKKAFDAVSNKQKELDVNIDEFVNGEVAKAKAEYNQSRIIEISVTVAAVVIGVIIALILSFSIVKVVNQMVLMLKDMAESGGDLTKRIDVKSKDEIGELAGWFNAFLDKLHDIISQIRQSAEMVASAANETSLGNQDLSQRTEEQASSLEEISSTIEEVTASLQKSSESSSEADVSSKSTLQTVRKGENVVNELHGAMVEITKGSHAIAEIIAKVNDIAFQTNLLALNAAVEAARAGEQGRGFAVVAAEVRNLAGRTAESAKEIEGLIKESIQKVEHGNELMEQTATVLSDIVENTQKTTDVIAEIASSMREQSAAADDIRTAVEQLNQVTQQNASLVEEIAGSSEAVSNEAEEMTALVGKFKLNDYVGNQSRNNLTKLPMKETGHFSAKLAAAAGEQGNTKPLERLSANFNENDFEKF